MKSLVIPHQVSISRRIPLDAGVAVTQLLRHEQELPADDYLNGTYEITSHSAPGLYISPDTSIFPVGGNGSFI